VGSSPTRPTTSRVCLGVAAAGRPIDVWVPRVEFTTIGPSQLRYVDGQFQQNWKTPKAKGCYQVTVTTEGDSLSADFRLR
jgi:hypothetical protein